jgi:hypothetical protein
MVKPVRLGYSCRLWTELITELGVLDQAELWLYARAVVCEEVVELTSWRCSDMSVNWRIDDKMYNVS